MGFGIPLVWSFSLLSSYDYYIWFKVKYIIYMIIFWFSFVSISMKSWFFDEKEIIVIGSNSILMGEFSL